MFAVVADVERYPEFVPGCAGLRVRERERKGPLQYLTTEVQVSYHGLRERYTSRVALDPDKGAIDVHHLKGPFDHLDTRWRFTPRLTGCEVFFAIDFAFRNRLLTAVVGLVFDGMVRHTADAFAVRAAELYGSKEAAQ